MEIMIKQDGKNVENMVLQHVKKTDETGILEDIKRIILRSVLGLEVAGGTFDRQTTVGKSHRLSVGCKNNFLE